MLPFAQDRMAHQQSWSLRVGCPPSSSCKFLPCPASFSPPAQRHFPHLFLLLMQGWGWQEFCLSEPPLPSANPHPTPQSTRPGSGSCSAARNNPTGDLGLLFGQAGWGPRTEGGWLRAGQLWLGFTLPNLGTSQQKETAKQSGAHHKHAWVPLDAQVLPAPHSWPEVQKLGVAKGNFKAHSFRPPPPRSHTSTARRSQESHSC